MPDLDVEALQAQLNDLRAERVEVTKRVQGFHAPASFVNVEGSGPAPTMRDDVQPWSRPGERRPRTEDTPHFPADRHNSRPQDRVIRQREDAQPRNDNGSLDRRQQQQQHEGSDQAAHEDGRSAAGPPQRGPAGARSVFGRLSGAMPNGNSLGRQDSNAPDRSAGRPLAGRLGQQGTALDAGRRVAPDGRDGRQDPRADQAGGRRPIAWRERGGGDGANGWGGGGGGGGAGHDDSGDGRRRADQGEEEGLGLSASAAAVDVNGKRRLMSRAVAVSAPLQEEGVRHGMQLEGGQDQHGGGARGQYGPPFEVGGVAPDTPEDQVGRQLCNMRLCKTATGTRAMQDLDWHEEVCTLLDLNLKTDITVLQIIYAKRIALKNALHCFMVTAGGVRSINRPSEAAEPPPPAPRAEQAHRNGSSSAASNRGGYRQGGGAGGGRGAGGGVGSGSGSGPAAPAPPIFWMPTEHTRSTAKAHAEQRAQLVEWKTDLLAEMGKEIQGLTERSEARKVAAARRPPHGRGTMAVVVSAAGGAQHGEAQQQPGGGGGAAAVEEGRMPESREDEEMGGEYDAVDGHHSQHPAAASRAISSAAAAAAALQGGSSPHELGFGMLKEAQARHVGAPQCWHSGNPREGGASGWWCFRGGIGRKGVCVGADVQDCNSWLASPGCCMRRPHPSSERATQSSLCTGTVLSSLMPQTCHPVPCRSEVAVLERAGAAQQQPGRSQQRPDGSRAGSPGRAEARAAGGDEGGNGNDNNNNSNPEAGGMPEEEDEAVVAHHQQEAEAEEEEDVMAGGDEGEDGG
ncbi:MAG: hypothetical protein WDW38_001133 [Sanguina aurantia]